jgi:4-cresol dehydrogenase (hydroxylating)
MNRNHNAFDAGGTPTVPRAYEANITEYRPRTLKGVRFPQSTQEIQKLIQESRLNQQPLYPISTGRNWGLGSAQPVQDNCLLMDLSQMRAIRKVDARLRCAIIEPGVTQKQLADYLQQNHPELVFPMTGSGTETSIVGNILERGVCVRGHRYPFLLGLEVVLGNEEIVRTGMWHFAPDACQHVYAPGVGPDLNGLFTQSNLGIVSAMVIRLEKRQKRRLLSLISTDEYLEELTDRLFALREEGVLQDGLLLTGLQDPRTSAGEVIPKGRWFASASLQGSEGMQEAAMLQVRYQLENLCQQLRFYEIDKMPENVEPAYLKNIAQMYQGTPTNYALETMARLGGSELEGRLEIDEAPDVNGFVCALPVVPFAGRSVRQAVSAVEEISEAMGVQAYCNFVGMTPVALEGFFRVFFDRADPEAIATAHQWNRRVHKRLRDMGFPPYRLNIEQMQEQIQQSDDSFWDTILQIKNTLDPDHVLAPGRYCPYHPTATT